VRRGPKPPGVVFDADDLLEFATGKVANVFGESFAPVDRAGRRVRLPAPPYHFVSRVTALDAETSVFQPSFIRTEYDVPVGAWYAVDGQVPPAVTIEAGQCDMLLAAYLGIDFENRGERIYRLLDSSLVFHGNLPHEGQRLRYDIWIDRWVRTPGPTLFFFRYQCFADDELILELKDACAGFFTDDELAASQGVNLAELDRRRRRYPRDGQFKPLARTGRTRLDSADLAALGRGEIPAVFGSGFEQGAMNPSLRLPTGDLLMVDEVTRLDRLGGRAGLGSLSAVKRLAPDGWYFTSHFPDDPVLAGSLVAEGAVQLLQTYALSVGLHLCLPDTRFQPVPGLETDVKVRGQITPEHRELRYEVEIVDIGLLPRPFLIADVLVYLGDKAVISITNLGIRIEEKPGTPYRPERGGIVPADLGRRNAAGEPAMLSEFHLAHAAKGDLATAMGTEFEIYRDSRAPYIPNGDFLYVDRVMGLTGTRGELRPGAVMVTEYDAPPEAWYFAENGDAFMPNFVYMESSLQAAILLGYYLGATLPHPDREYAIRNLDGNATLVRAVDLRGRTIRQTSTLLSSQAVPGAILQRFRYELAADGEVFYTGESLFGYFSEQALANQVGLDSGRHVTPWLDRQQLPPGSVRSVDLAAMRARTRGPRLPSDRLALLDRLDVVPDGGEHGKGYLRAHRAIRPEDWYFERHFHRDPVMPGSLGVEAIIEAVRAYIVEVGLADGIADPRFAMPAGVRLQWRYRGQILRADREMEVELHVKEVRRDGGKLLLVGDASLWKPGLRIYELTDVAVEVRPGGDAA
jgi:3-hydroxymyristoyl/3-hydroxydecanoyl-(acyl carrier protein) dehydratase